jgi:acyl-CoA synthetase (AMP-forming)/AMP-acid ligase II
VSAGNELTVGDLVRLGAIRSPDRIALKMRGGRAVNYAQLDERTDRLANALLGLGLEPGDRVGALLDDSAEYVELYLAVAKAGLVMVPINARLRAAEADYPLADSGARALFFSDGLAGDVAELEGIEELTLVSVGGAEGPESHDFEELLAKGAASRPMAPQPTDPYIIGYTSGTTGRPKGAILTHRSVLAIARLNSVAYRLPLFSVAALTGSMSFVATVPAHIIAHLYLGGTLLVMGRWDAEDLIATIEAERATFFYMPSPLITEFVEVAARQPKRWASLESILHSGSRAAPEKLRSLAEVVGGRFVEGLGMTENSGGLITATTREDIVGESAALDVFASAGRAVAESAVEILDQDGNPTDHDGETIGELAIRSPALMAGYWNLPEATAAVLKDGWYLTGDLGSIDPAGYVYIADRRTDLIVSGGMNVYPSEVEDFIRTMPGVAEVAVVGLPHERWGQTVTAAVIPDTTAEVDSEQVIEFCRAGLASYKKPTAVRFFADLPRTASLKLKRSEIRKQLEAEAQPG